MLANVLGLLVGFMLGVLSAARPGAIVGYFVYSFVLPTLAACSPRRSRGSATCSRGWTSTSPRPPCTTARMSGQQWAQLGVTTSAWLVVPTLVGVWLVLRSEVK